MSTSDKFNYDRRKSQVIPLKYQYKVHVSFANIDNSSSQEKASQRSSPKPKRAEKHRKNTIGSSPKKPKKKISNRSKIITANDLSQIVAGLGDIIEEGKPHQAFKTYIS